MAVYTNDVFRISLRGENTKIVDVKHHAIFLPSDSDRWK